ncbi:hypothetical protein [Clostridium sp. C8-1-8]|jgi:hypothetical protein|uniref:hypothetical protein n=1 Tax=Clostridium sp. C8-1-8 TaxID=2698831 RepID=UPI001369662A|nr:hypothetical protein [Clostridium sp. C8-1-8]
MKKRKILIIGLMVVGALALLTGCIPGDGSRTVTKPAGFFSGIWHGWIAPISLVGGLFNKHLRIYEVNNTGWFYDLGFYAAVISGFGGISLFRKKSKND